MSTHEESPRRRLRAMLAASLSTGAGVFLISIMAVWQKGGSEIQQYVTELRLHSIKRDVEEYKGRTGHFPDKLTDVEDEYHVRDGWHRPFVYEAIGDSYSVKSLGRDGTPGGQGLDYDLSSDDPGISKARPTFTQFVTTIRPGSFMVCVLGGLFGSLIVICDVGNPKLVRARWPSMAQIVAVIIVTGCMTAVAAIFHSIPSGH